MHAAFSQSQPVKVSSMTNDNSSFDEQVNHELDHMYKSD